MGRFESTGKVTVESLEKLQSELKILSETLMDGYELLGAQLSELGEDWQDAKFDEFEEEFKSSKEKIREISERYLWFADKYLPPRIDQLKDILGTGMGVK